jgi:hypothetical protein
MAATLATFAPTEEKHHHDNGNYVPTFAPTEPESSHHHHPTTDPSGSQGAIGPVSDHSIGSLFFLIAIVSIMCYFIYQHMQKNKREQEKSGVPTVAINFQLPELNVSRKYGYQVIADEA